ncbi:hypothetical protein BGW41_001754 [Actinomortierella wolfii]|nr:hypothetical protein BGW41_001754 [Actinomortierella wolfii]
MTWSSLRIFTSLVASPWTVEVKVGVRRPGQDHSDTILCTALIHPKVPDENTIGNVGEDWHTLIPKNVDSRLEDWQLQASMITSPPPSNAAQCAIQSLKVRLYRLPASPRGLEGDPTHLEHATEHDPVHHEPCPIEIHSFKAALTPSLSQEMPINLEGKESFSNGFQSWSKSQGGQDANSVFEKPNWLYNQITQLGLASDMDIYEYPGRRGVVHSYVWTVLRDKANVNREHTDTLPKCRRPNELVFCGSLSENLGYTYFVMDHASNTLAISQDVKGRVLHKHGDSLALKTFFAWGNNDAKVWDEYAAAWKSTHGDRRVIKDSGSEQTSGWTSWYLHYENISEAIVLDNLNYYTSTHLDHTHPRWPAKVVQIDDGYTNKFPHGMKHVAEKIREQGLMPGLWMAPFCASKKSKIVQEHPEWFIHWPKGMKDQFWNPFTCCSPRERNATKMMLAHPAFHAGAVALDIENPQVREHLANVFRVVTQDWGFRILKLDFLFAAAQVPRNGKTRGQLMWEAMQMIRDWAGSETLLLGCGVPLGSAMMLTDYCRIGCDVGAAWDSPQRFFHDREYISTFNSLTGTIGRWGLSGRFFGNDPDVYFTRTWSMGLTRQERLTLLTLNHFLGHLVLTSDPMDIQNLDGDQKWMLTLVHPWPSMPGFSKMPTPKVIRVIQPLVNQPDVYLIHVEWNERVLIVAVNLTCKRQQVCLSVLDQVIAHDHGEDDGSSTIDSKHASIYFHSVLGLFGAASSAYTLQKRETVVFVRIKDSKGRLCVPSGISSGSQLMVLTTRCGHLLPTAEIASIEGNQIHLHPLPAGLARSTQVWLARRIPENNSIHHNISSDALMDAPQRTETVVPWTVNGKKVQLEVSCSSWAKPSYEIGSVWI